MTTTKKNLVKLIGLRVEVVIHGTVAWRGVLETLNLVTGWATIRDGRRIDEVRWDMVR